MVERKSALLYNGNRPEAFGEKMLQMLYVVLMTFCLLGWAAAAEAAPPTCESLAEKDAKVRWMSLPLSRIVVNPFGMEPITLPEGLAPCLKTDLAYYSGEHPIKLPCFWAWRVTGSESEPPPVVAGPAADFSGKAADSWAQSQAKAEFKANELRVTVTESKFGSASCEVTVDLDETPYIVLQVAGTEGQWALKLNDGSSPVDVSLEMGAWGPGTYTYDVKSATGWSGKKAFRVLLFAVGAVGSSTTFSGLRFVGTRANAPQLSDTTFAWAPHALESSAAFSSPKAQITSTLFMTDDSAVAQVVKLTEGGPQTLVLTGQFLHANVSWDAKRNAVVIRSDHYSARISLGRKARWLGACDSWPGLLAGTPQTKLKSGVWAVAVDGVNAGEEVIIEARFAPEGQSLPEATPDLSAAGIAQALASRKADWDERLASVPQPLDFALARVDAKGTTPETIRRMYYKAWTFLLSDTIPEMPENRYPYPQVACGKPSLWAEGHPKSRPSAQWESMIGMQFLTWADPETAWNSFEGMMTLVDENGMMAGEGLPSRHVQTAWMLYSATGDSKRLKKVYPALKRMLLWKISDPRWVFKELTSPTSKDFEFVAHALLDAGFAVRIAKVLNMPQEEKLWQAQIEALAANADKWFWDDNGSGPYEIYEAATNKRGAIHSPWNLQAIALPKGLLTPAHEKSNLDVFRSMILPNAPFAGTVLCKHPSYQLTMLGVWRHGLIEDAAVMAEAIMREITLAGEFAECYTFTFPPKTEGVTPSLFGVCNIIDGALWRNGVIVGEGLPIIARVPGAKGVRNIRLKSGHIDVLFGADDKVTLSGQGLKKLALPKGFTASEGPVWQGKVPVGSEIRLEESK